MITRKAAYGCLILILTGRTHSTTLRASGQLSQDDYIFSSTLSLAQAQEELDADYRAPKIYEDKTLGYLAVKKQIIARNLTVCNDTILNNLVVEGNFDICGVPACQLINAYGLLLTATSADIPHTLILRDTTGSFYATTITVTGVLELLAADGDTVTLQPNPTTDSYIFQLPPNGGSNGYVLSTDGTGITSWIPVSAVGGGGITDLNGLTTTTQFFANGYAGIEPTFNSAINTHTLNIPLASTYGVLAGLISSTDYYNFNSTYTTGATGTPFDIPNTLVLRDNTGSFAATNVSLQAASTNQVTLAPQVSTSSYTFQLPPNTGIVNYVLTTNGAGVTSWQSVSAEGAITDLNNLTTSTQYFANGYAGIQPAFNSALNTHTLNIPLASTYGVLAGLISSTDYYHFQNTYTTVAAGSFITTITGDTGSISGQIVSLQGRSTAGSSVTFQGVGTAMTLNVTDTLFNTMIGLGAGNTHMTGTGNTALGYNAGSSITSGFGNVLIGYQAGNQLTTATGSVYISYTNASGSVGSSSVCIGFNIDNNNNNVVIIGSNANAGTNSVAIGGSATGINSVTINGTVAGSQSVGIGTSSSVPSANAIGIGFSSVARGVGSIAIGNTVTASAPNSIILGGTSNTLTGTQATVIGGNNNSASGFNSYALGQNASASNNYSFVYSDSTLSPYSSHANNSFNVRAAGGAYFDANITTTGTVNFVTNGNTLTLQPNASTNTYSFTLPPNTGTPNYVLTTDGTGITSWQSVSAFGAIIDLNNLTTSTQFFANGFAGIQPAFNSAINTHTLNIPLASTYGVLAGLITSTDYYHFQNTYTTLAAGYITTITGDTGSISGQIVSLQGRSTAGSSVTFQGVGTAMTLNVTDTLFNTMIGLGAGNTHLTGTANTALGYNAGTALTSGFGNVFLGASAGSTITTGSANVIIGGNTSIAATTSFCVSIGYQTGGATNAVVVGGQASGNTGSVALGKSSNASGSQSVCVGQGTITAGTQSVGIGEGASVAGAQSVGIGQGAKVPYASAVGVGNGTQAFAQAATLGYLTTTTTGAIAIGYLTTANGVNSIAIGKQVAANGQNSIALGGVSNTVNGTQVTVIGGNNNSASGFNSYALGQNASASNNYSFVYSDSTLSPYSSHANNSFNVRAAGGAYFDANITTTGTVNFVTNSNTLTLQPNASTNTYSFTLPPNTGTANYVLTTDGTGITSWQSISAFGAIIDLNNLTTSTQFFANGFAGIQPAFNSAINTHTLNIPLASTYGVLAGLITSTDYYHFQNTYTTLAAGYITTITGDTGSISGQIVSLQAKSTAGSSVTFQGVGTAMTLNVTDTLFNTMIGLGAGNLHMTGTGNTALGYNAGTALTTGYGNVLIGYQAGNQISTGTGNVFISGTNASGNVGSSCVCIGFNLGFNNTNNIVLIGSQVNAGTNSVAIGGSATGINSVTINGTAAGSQSIAIGTSSSVPAANAIGIGFSSVARGVGSIAIGNTVTASAPNSIILGGISNTLTGTQATVIGGNNNTASGFNSYALGQNASASNNYSFVYSDSTLSPYSSHANNSFNVRAAGGAYFDANITTTGTVNFVTNGNTLTLQPNASTNTYSFTLPPNTGTANYVLTTDGTGITSWQSVSAFGAIIDLNNLTTSTQFFANGFAGIQPAFNSAINTHTLNIPLASTYGVLAGLITSTDYYHFQNTYTTLAAGYITTITGDTGSISGQIVSLQAKSTAGSSVTFQGVGTAMTLNVTDTLFNTMIGLGAGNLHMTGTANTALGFGAGGNITTGYGNVLIGYQAGNAISTGTGNVWIGGTNASGSSTISSCVCIGFNIDLNANNAVVIGVSGSGIGNNSVSIGGTAATNSVTLSGNAAGVNSIAIGLSSITPSPNAVGIGSTAKAYTQAAALGYQTTATTNAVALGYLATATGINSIAIGNQTIAYGQNSIALGGVSNTVNGTQVTVIGGNTNTATGFNSYALGQNASASNNYSFVYSDSTLSPYSSHANNSFNVRAAGGAYFDANITTTGTVNFVTNGNTLTLQPNASTNTYSFTLPPNTGTLNYVLTTDGTGITNWQSVSAFGAIIDLNNLTTSTQFFANGFAGIQPAFNSAINTHTLNIPLASTYGVLAGLITSTDYYHFQNTYTTVAAGTFITTITGDTGSISGQIVSLQGKSTAGSSVTFQGVGTAMTFNVTDVLANTIMGLGAGNTLLTGSCNTALGYNAANALTNGSFNVFLGYEAGFKNTSGSFNTFAGPTAGAANTTGINNTFIGNSAGFANTTASGNTFIGSGAGSSITTGGNNTMLGVSAGSSIHTGTANTLLGVSAGSSYTSSESNNIVIAAAGKIGESNITRIGNNYIADTASSNIFAGINSGNSTYTAGTANNNSALGVATLSALTTGTNNTALGAFALANLTTGINNIAVGVNALSTITNTSNAIGIGQLTSAASGAIAIGNFANASGPNSLLIGGLSNTLTGTQATVIGGNNNTASGFNSYALGQFASASNNYSFVYSDSTLSPYSSHANNSFNVRAAGGAYFDANITTTGVANFVTNGNTLTLQPNASTTTYSFTLPPNTGSPNYVLTTDGTGITSWQIVTSAGAAITDLNNLTAATQFFANGSSGIQPAFNSAINTHTLNIPLASTYGVLAGLITSTDYYHFQNTYTTVAAGSFITTITGDTGSISGQIVSLQGKNTAGSSVTFQGVGAAMTLNVTDTLANTIIGLQAGNTILTGSGNTAFGYQAANALTSGFFNVFLGYQAGLKNTSGAYNTFAGYQAGAANTIGINNTFIGFDAGTANTTASGNTIIGSPAGQKITTGGNNTIIGYSTASNITTGTANTIIGSLAGSAYTSSESNNIIIGQGITGKVGESNLTRIGSNYIADGINNIFVGQAAGNLVYTGTGNIGIGQVALASLTTGTCNTIVGVQAGQSLTTGGNNTIVGQLAGSAYTSSETNNILIGQGVTGTVGESNVIRIGSAQTSCFITGINGATSSGGTAVFVNSSNQLGTLTSSERFKENIVDMGDYSSPIMQLRPVIFNYKTTPDVISSGLIAEEVAQIMPQLVYYDAEGLPFTVQYHDLPALLLNELQKLQAPLHTLQEQTALLEAQVQELRCALEKREPIF